MKHHAGLRAWHSTRQTAAFPPGHLYFLPLYRASSAWRGDAPPLAGDGGACRRRHYTIRKQRCFLLPAPETTRYLLARYAPAAVYRRIRRHSVVAVPPTISYSLQRDGSSAARHFIDVYIASLVFHSHVPLNLTLATRWRGGVYRRRVVDCDEGAGVNGWTLVKGVCGRSDTSARVDAGGSDAETLLPALFTIYNGICLARRACFTSYCTFAADGVRRLLAT